MVILDKNFKFIKWFNSKLETPKLELNEVIEKDETVPFVFFQGEKIIKNPGFYTEDQIQIYLDLGYEMIDRYSFGWIDGKSKHEIYNNNGKAELKTEEMLLNEA